ncbi:otitis media-associated H10 [Streptococcus oralis subsp. dentisani]|uniref:Otitis media-associated H10 n=1 Tax=Streptococcus oralis subsp. dentisani TaxID=1458253 RepID=A0A2I1UBW5_STROR|nr:FtsK/SpoIIIE domain-containing protein [Streptococcus oralis]MDT5638763.1 FtsK/SpoIIIE domain-containing protein [Streptococcus pneumoniae]MDT5669987.1 FtsK/SpoIIIE domain-containing protein [Streptococcus pneumoniae]MDT6126646.1 FtsK/SpoIIIE domain-containing protein [Streptococcus pneumoniae]PLA03358.1 otitis media-associated H10 [Streptococcus oralis subsp. dentisani]
MFKLRQSADLTRNNIISCYKLKIMHWLILSISACILFSTIVNIRAPTFVQILFIFLGGFIIYKIHLKIKIFRYNLEHYLIIRESLLYVLHTNRLYTTYKDSTGQEKVIRSAILEYDLDRQNSHILIKALITGDEFSKKLQSLDDLLCGALELELEEKIIRPSYVEYHFYYKKPDRLVLQSHNQRQDIDSLDIDLGYGVNYNPVKCPHILVSGGTGSGKSVLISVLILEFLKRQSTVYIADPKNSDLGSLSHYFGNKYVATTPNNIARIVRIVVEEMQERYQVMRDNFQYGSNFSEHGFKPICLILDEMGAFQASGTDKKSKEVIVEVMDGIKQIILLGRQAGVFILISAQQMRAETLNTDLRDNLGLRIALGANSSEGYRMVFGSATPDKLKPIEVKGAGYLYMQGSGKETAQYWESPYLDTTQFDFIKELQLYITKLK